MVYNQNKLVLTVGISASGKSTWANKQNKDKYKSKKIKLYNYEVWAFSKSAEDNYKIYYEKECNTKREALRYCRKFMLKIKKKF